MSVMPFLAQVNAGGAGFSWELPPLHPILVNFTAALLPASLFSDVLGKVLRKESLLSAGWWMLLYAAAITPFTALAGWWWLRDMEGMDMSAMSIHKWLGTALAVVVVALVVWRWRIQRAPGAVPSVRYLAFASLVLVALMTQGHLGGLISFGSDTGSEERHEPGGMHRHGAGPTSGAESPPDRGMDEGQHNQWADHIDLPKEN